METGAIIALGSLLVAFIALLVSARRDTRGEAASQAQVNAKLDSIAGGVDDIRVEQRAQTRQCRADILRASRVFHPYRVPCQRSADKVPVRLGF